jgi:ribonuclease T2
MPRASRPRWSSAATLAAALTLAAAGTAQAQAYQCRVPAAVPRASLERPDGPARRTAIVGYTLALSWAPEFCRARARDAAHLLECSGAMGRFGFVVHGLRPEGASAFPQWCRRVAPPDPALVRQQLCRTPSVALIGHQWAKHGSCMAREAKTYFRIANILADSIRYPAMERLSRQPLTAGVLRAELVTANRGRPADSFGLRLSRNGWLQEVLVCMDREFMPRRCPASQMGARDAATVKIWRGL